MNYSYSKSDGGNGFHTKAPRNKADAANGAGTLIAMTRILLLIMSLTVGITSSALAHRDYEHPVGTFQRADGNTISIVEYYTDGIFAADPVLVQFRLPDGSVFASTDFASDVVIRRPSSSTVEVYQFEGTFIPIAACVHRFDGYALSDVTSARRAVSPLVHTAHYWLGYITALVVAAFFVVVWFGARSLPHHGWLAAVRILGFCFAVLVGALYLLMLLWMTPLSPPILFLLGLVCYLIYTSRRRGSRPK